MLLIICVGVGVNMIDLNVVSLCGIYVCNCLGKNIVVVVELVIGFMIVVDWRICDVMILLCEGKWKKKEFGKVDGFKDWMLGLFGFGVIGWVVVWVV